MKKTLLLITTTTLFCACGPTQLDPSKEWRVCSRDRYTLDKDRAGICRIKITDGVTFESFDDSCHFYVVGDTSDRRIHTSKLTNDSMSIY